MHRPFPYNRFAIACVVVLGLFFVIQSIIPHKQASISPPNEESFYEIEGYVVSKRINSKIWIAEEPTRFFDRLTGHLFSDYKGLVIVSEHSDVNGEGIFNHLKVNQKVRVYADALLESYPAKTNAYYVEVVGE